MMIALIYQTQRELASSCLEHNCDKETNLWSFEMKIRHVLVLKKSAFLSSVQLARILKFNTPLLMNWCQM